ncbi:hypothetical protein [Halorussus sp. MSC15.2]|uniref:DUF7344 domain-containing protein n=1 Tax=Halorussus sp. MSC15.2 TaxID=2283638 RepID=UPI0013D7AEA4|nr:hypothetical protein [Halorussus sp. MSC15.2]NEU56208.1 hypothetical protein [Halorussus sp. MSC15.2]
MTTTDTHPDDTADAEPCGPESGVSLDATFAALADRECRDLLWRLAESDDETFLVTDLAARLTDGTESDDATGNAETRLTARLHHTVLPKLDDAGLVAYETDRGLVRSCLDSRYAAMVEGIAGFESADRPVPLDTLFELLADFRRRTAYLTLLRHDDLSLPDLADEVAVAERGEPLSKVDPDDVLRVYLSLYHTHVPKLADTGLVAYDQEDDYVALTDVGRALESPTRALCDPSDD